MPSPDRKHRHTALRNIGTAVGCALLTLTLAAPTVAHHIGGASYTPGTLGSTGKIQKTWRTTNDSFALYMNAKWDATHRSGITQYYANGWRYTQEFNDGSCFLPPSLNANGRFSTTFENPEYDRDDDDGDKRNEEAEVTANSTSFPSVNSNYYVDMQFSHWYSDNGTWRWDSDSSEIGYLSQMSAHLFGEWQSQRFSSIYKCISTPFQPAPAGASSAVAGSDDSAVGEPEGTSFDVGTYRAIAESDHREVDVWIAPPTDLGAYLAQNARGLAALSRRPGPYTIMVTFKVPLSVEDARASLGADANITYVESVGTQGDLKMTVGGPTLGPWINEQFDSLSASMTGVVAAQVSVASGDELRRLSRDSNVLLADVAAEVIQRDTPQRVRGLSSGGRLDVLLNDVYWIHAGWAE
jgi:hypothetical protein